MMRERFLLGVAAVAILLAVGCKKNKAVVLFDQYADEFCACKDLACMVKVDSAYAEKFKQLGEVRGTEADQGTLDKAHDKAKACADKHKAALEKREKPEDSAKMASPKAPDAKPAAPPAPAKPAPQPSPAPASPKPTAP